MNSDPTRASFEAVMRAGQAAEPSRTQRLLAWLAYYSVFAILAFAVGFWAIEQLAISPFVVLGTGGVALFIARLLKRRLTATPFRIGLVVGTALPLVALSLVLAAGGTRPGAATDASTSPTAAGPPLWYAPLQKLKRRRTTDPGDSHIVFSASGDDTQVVVGFKRCVSALHQPDTGDTSLHRQTLTHLTRRAPEFAAADILHALVIHVCQRFDAGDLDALHAAFQKELPLAMELLENGKSQNALCSPDHTFGPPAALSLTLAALCELRADQARALRLFTEGHTLDAVAAALDTSPAAAERLLKEGRLNVEEHAHRLARVHHAL
ncbi:hypothetical protein EA187_02505 [Lujinxingia sediminis]|uniref:Sigma-70 family RNA polymerase sigma factor n=1 Tax=Lujinxingia sediminis TaxID=2480984 RepID=A0ABY0CXA3_9DELT|nr:hypothetical protein [Lujinxingia sediminis]RVU48329.1 hypothetical protein EA187_02505 [Lujinxingia sediminis]